MIARIATICLIALTVPLVRGDNIEITMPNPVDLILKSGSTAVLFCKPNKPAIVTFLKDNNQLSESSRISIRNETLIIRNVTGQDDGLYRCRVNIKGTFWFLDVHEERELFLYIGEPKIVRVVQTKTSDFLLRNPNVSEAFIKRSKRSNSSKDVLLRVTTQEELIKELGDSALLFCEIDDPNATVSFFRNGTLLMSNHEYEVGANYVRIRNLTGDHFGPFFCHVQLPGRFWFLSSTVTHEFYLIVGESLDTSNPSKSAKEFIEENPQLKKLKRSRRQTRSRSRTTILNGIDEVEKPLQVDHEEP